MHLTEHARAKVNLTLRILGRRADGYHELESIVLFADVGDLLTLEPSEKLDIRTPGFAINAADNLMSKAAALFAARFGEQPFRITLDKRLPVSAGIGGGSADAAAVLRLLGRAQVELNGADPEYVGDVLRSIAPDVGSDVAACLVNRACRMRGRGELVSEIALEKSLAAVLINSGDAVPHGKTPAVFRALAAPPLGQSVALAGARNETDQINDLQLPAMTLMPAIKRVLESLGELKGVTAARMSGAGPTCFGLFETMEQARVAELQVRAAHPGWWACATVLS